MLIAGFVFLNSQKNQDEDISGYIIHYHESYFEYDIETLNDKISVNKGEVVQCDQAPCNPLGIDSFTVNYTNEYRSFFKEIFENTQEKELYLWDDDLTIEQKEIIHKIIKE